MTEINYSKIQQELRQWKEVVDNTPGFMDKHKDLVELLSDTKFLITASSNTQRNLLIALGQAADSYGLNIKNPEPNGNEKNESSEVLSDYIDTAYIDVLLQDENLHDKSKQQLENIKNILLDNPNSKLTKDRLVVKNGFVVIDGFGLPDKVTLQTYADMSAENSKQLYPDYTIALLNFTAELTGKTFDRGTLNNKNLTDRSLSHEEILKILNTDNNNAILESLSTIMGKVNKYQYIPMGIDSNGYVIYAFLSPGYIGFFYGSFRYGFNDCLVPSHIGG